MHGRTRAQAWLAAIIAVVTALALQVASVRAVSCDRADALVSGVRAVDDRVGDAVSAPSADGTSVAADLEHGTCVSAIVLAPAALSTFAFPDCERTVPTAALTRARRISSGLERPPRLA